MNHNSIMYQRKMTKVNTTMTKLMIPKEMSSRIRDFVTANHDGNEAKELYVRFIVNLCPSIK